MLFYAVLCCSVEQRCKVTGIGWRDLMRETGRWRERERESERGRERE